jgi:hypothetical protein
MIAGNVAASHAKLATRNLTHVEDIASSVVNPWDKGEDQGLGNRE